MSTAETSGQDPNPNHKSPKQAHNRPDQTLAADLPPDPLLGSGSFIDATATGGHRTPEPLRKHLAPLASENSNGAKPVQTTPAPENAGFTTGAQSSRPDWLPPTWHLQEKVRTSGATAGTVDRYYFDPVSGCRFRSKTEVFYFLETGTRRKKGKLTENSDADTMGSGGQKQKKSATKAKSSTLKFNFLNVPEKVNWVFTDSSQGSWAPFIGDKKVPESKTQEWASAFTALTSSRHDSQMMF